jgi:hypothetical protein
MKGIVTPRGAAILEIHSRSDRNANQLQTQAVDMMSVT